ncbi:TPA_asm: protein 3 [Aponogeton virus 1]|uniref:Protein 3 n=1 Tax=Aponogeton virus 1 TaxID=2977952 RepID=A0A9N6YJ80_9RHAB|nr:TPA_asm: protein 3 [Aponogeton virus 1]
MASRKSFTGISRTLSVRKEKEPIQVEISNSQSGISKTPVIVDNIILELAPTEKIRFERKWAIQLTSEKALYDLNESGWKDVIMKNVLGRGNLHSPEIHVIWIPHIPLDNFQDVTVNISCEFTPTTDPERKLIGATVYPVGMLMHSIFKPGHSIKLGAGERIPWAIGSSISENIFEPGYTIAELYISLIGYKTVVGGVDTNRGTALISLMPYEEKLSGISLSRPREVGKKWIMTNCKLGLSSSADMKKILRLQEIGMDIEALSQTKMLKTILNSIKMNDLLDPKADAYLVAMRKIQTIMMS